MIVLSMVALLQGLLLAARCELGAGGPKLIDEEEARERPQHPRWDHTPTHLALGTGHHHREGAHSPHASGGIRYPLEHEHADRSREQPLPGRAEERADASGETGTRGTPARMGNWCAFVHKRMVTLAVSCGTEKYTIKSHSPCPNGTPNCQLVMYKLSTRPVYREKQKIFTALLWRCCPGHGGNNCEDIVTDSNDSEDEDSGSTRGPGPLHTGSEQNDHQDVSSAPYEVPSSNRSQTEEHIYDYPNSPHEHQYERGDPYAVYEEHRNPPPEATDPNPGLLPVLRDIMMSHLQPVLNNFNQTLERLSKEMKVLQRDVAQLQLRHGPEMEPVVLGGGVSEGDSGLLQHEDKLTESFQQLEDLRSELILQHDIMEQKLQYNLTSFKADMDIKIKRNQKAVQTNLQSLNSSLSEVKQVQEQLEAKLQSIWTQASMTTSQENPQKDTAIWEAISRLDDKVVNNTVTLSALSEGQVLISEKIDYLQRGWKALDDRIDKTDRKSEDKYIEAFLEVDGAKEAVQKYVHDLATNITILQKSMYEMEEDLDSLYNSTSSSSEFCHCKAMRTSMDQLKQALANVTMFANENRLALDSAAEARLDNWENGGWGPSMDDLKMGLLNVQNSLAFEQSKSRTLQQNVTMLHTSLLGSQMDIEALQEMDRIMAADIKYTSSSFRSLINDVLKHAKVLEILLGEEVPDFMDWPPEDQEAQSLPYLKNSIMDLQEQINKHSQRLSSMLKSAPPDTVADEPLALADWTSAGLSWEKGNQKFDQASKTTDYTDTNLFVLEEAVEQLRARVVRQEEQQCISCCNCTKGAAPGGVEAKLQTELITVRKSLEDHLRIFSSLFSNAEGLLGSETTIDLDRLFSLMRRKEGKLQRKREKKRADMRREERREHVNLHTKRDASLETAAFSQLPESPFMFLASSQDGVNTPGMVVFETVTLNHGQMYSPKTGTFRAPSSGVYLFMLTLDFSPGPSLARLKRGVEVAASLHQNQKRLAGPATRVCLLQLEQGEELHLEIVRGSLENSNPQDNTFAGILLLQTT